MPLLEDTSGTNRSIKTIEVLDISDGEAMSYLVYLGVKDDIAKKIVEMVGANL